MSAAATAVQTLLAETAVQTLLGMSAVNSERRFRHSSPVVLHALVSVSAPTFKLFTQAALVFLSFPRSSVAVHVFVRESVTARPVERVSTVPVFLTFSTVL